EYLNRPTARAAWWAPPNQHVLGGRDLLRDVQGTWLGVTKDGRIAVLTNFRERGQEHVGIRSRGAMVNAFLTQAPKAATDTEDFIKALVEDDGILGVGGFSLVCGFIGKPLAVVSNRTPSVEGTIRIAARQGETIGLSNAAFGDRSWPKVVKGEDLMASAIEKSIREEYTKEQLINEMMQLLSIDTLPRREDGEGLESYISQLRNSIFIPVIGSESTKETPADEVAAASKSQPLHVMDSSRKTSDNVDTSGSYGTQKQTTVLVDQNGLVTFMERTLYDESGRAIPKEAADLTFEFKLEKR
ncbi:MAG: hypothetical protein Q9187_002791, partial [Circinaria calcarea]